MTIPMPFTIVDVFAESKYAGNQLAIFKNAEYLSSETMQKLAKETNFSETTFILSDKKSNDGYNVRIFTPNCEVPFAGHPTLGTAFVLQDEFENSPQDQININYSIGQIPVSFPEGKSGKIWMQQMEPAFGPILSADDIFSFTNLSKEDIDPRFPIQVVSTGLPQIILPLSNLKSIQSLRVNKERFLAFVENFPAKSLLTFSQETVNSEANLHVRVFVDYYGIPEDPATGSGNGCLAGYLVEQQVLNSQSIDISVEQGLEINRPSRLYLRSQKKGSHIEIHVGGKVQKIAVGSFF